MSEESKSRARKASPSNKAPKAKKSRSPGPRKHAIEETAHEVDMDVKELETSDYENEAEEYSTAPVSEKEENDNEEAGERSQTTPSRPAAHHPPEEDFAIQVYYDRQNQKFYGTCLEFPDLKVDGIRRDHVVEELSQRIGDELEMLRREGATAPTPFSARTYPEKLEARISKSLYRRLDVLSRIERVPLDQLVSELLTQSLNRRTEGAGRSQDNRRSGPPQHKNHSNHGNNHNRNHGNHHNRGGQGGGGNRNRNFHDNNRGDNFLEYVRNLEKGGGFSKKR